MISSQFRKKILSERMLVLRIIWGAIMMSVVTFGFVLYVTKDAAEPSDELPAVMFYALGAMVALASVVVRQIWMSDERLLAEGRMNPRGPSLGAKTPQERKAELAFGRYQVGSLLAFSLAEACAIFGFVHSFVSKDMKLYGVLAGVALALLLFVHAPSSARLAALLEKIETSPQGGA